MPVAASGSVLFSNGSFVQVSGSPDFYEIVGGAPLFVSDWTAVGGVQPYTVITQQQFDALNPVPANGTMFQTNTGAVYVVAGGAPMYVTSISVFVGAPQPLLVDEWNVDNMGNSAIPPEPAAGQRDLPHHDGRAELSSGGRRADRVTDWTVFGGIQSSVTIDPGTSATSSIPLAHLVVPADGRDRDPGPAVGRLLAVRSEEPLPRCAPTAGAVRVDDRGLVQFSAIPCRVPGPRPQDARAGKDRAAHRRLSPRQDPQAPRHPPPPRAAGDQAGSDGRGPRTWRTTPSASRSGEPVGAAPARPRSTRPRSRPR